ncbi:hypothetical protein DPMN_172294 [Dreissena polymorpha]|uniref:Uncharacterized protein n=1 Tax=Dreissena polymorpha TaxID=45954 RepID=A0A9D4DZK0_DREPO|nr:hypothetical protein DPMN_172294 [Dreissena polymorpha]
MGTDQWEAMSQNDKQQKVMILDNQAVEQIQIGFGVWSGDESHAVSPEGQSGELPSERGPQAPVCYHHQLHEEK